MLNILNAALAFAITMLILSMMCSVIVETIHRLLRQREKGLQIMLGHVFDRVIAPQINIPKGQSRDTFVELMSVNRSPAGGAWIGFGPPRTGDATAEDPSMFIWPWNGRRMASLETMDFMARLGSSEFGKAILDKITGQDEAQRMAMLKDIAQRFEAFCGEASEFFQRRARFFSILTAFVLAFWIYVNPRVLLETYLHDPVLAQRVIEMQTDSVAENGALETAKATLEAARTGLKAANEATPPAPEDVKAAQDALKTAETAFDDESAKVRNLLEQLQTDNSAIGWTKDRSNVFSTRDLGLIPASLWLLLGGLLIGLGGPFWFDLIKSLTAIKSWTTGTKQDEDKTAETSAGADPTRQPVNPVESFLNAATAAGFYTAPAAAVPPDTGGGTAEEIPSVQ